MRRVINPWIGLAIFVLAMRIGFAHAEDKISLQLR